MSTTGTGIYCLFRAQSLKLKIKITTTTTQQTSTKDVNDL